MQLAPLALQDPRRFANWLPAPKDGASAARTPIATCRRCRLFGGMFRILFDGANLFSNKVVCIEDAHHLTRRAPLDAQELDRHGEFISSATRHCAVAVLRASTRSMATANCRSEASNCFGAARDNSMLQGKGP